MSWPTKMKSISDCRRLWSYQLSALRIFLLCMLLGFFGNLVSVLVVTLLQLDHVLHSWGLLAEENHHKVKRKEQGPHPTTE